MSINLRLLSKLGCNSKTLKAAFTAKKKSEEIETWTKRASDRIREAIDSNTRDYRLYAAIDKALDAPFYQKSHTLFQGLLDGKFDSAKVLSVLNEWGFGSSISTSCGCGQNCTNVGGCLNPKQTIDLKTFFEVDFPIPLAYLRIRVARMYNERNLSPLLLYTPRINSPKERLRTQILSHRVDVQGEQMNHRAVLKQLIMQSTAYGVCVKFPKEAWYSDLQPTDEMKGKKRVMRTAKEGIRYEHPHPCRMYYDLAHPAYTLNTDTGCQFAGNWSLVRYGDVADNKEYWNRENITYGQNSFRITDTNRMFFETVYPCSMNFPAFTSIEDGESAIVGKIDRQRRMDVNTYAEKDKALLLTTHFERINPLRDWGLKNKDGEGYDGNVWFRVTFAADDTVIHAEPLAYRPTVWSGYDADANRARNPSIVLEAIPAGDMIHNLFSQAILQAKNNLANINFINTDAIPKEFQDQLQNYGEKVYRRPIFIPFSAHEARSLSDEKQGAIIPVPIQKMPIVELMTLVKGVLDLLERSLVMSAQEIASTASHEQSATEVRQTATSTSTRLTFTGSFIDDAIHAWQVQLAEAGLAYWDDEIFAEVALQEDADEKVLEEMGFKIESKNMNERTAGVRGSKKALETSEFTIRRDAADRVNNPALATQMVQLFAAFSQNPLLLQAIGTGQVVKVFNEIAAIAGLPRDFRLSAINDPIKEAKDAQKKVEEVQKKQAEQASGELAKILPQIEQKILATVGEQLKPVFEKSAELDHQQEIKIQELQQEAVKGQQAFAAVIQKLESLVQAAAPPPMITPPPMMPPQLPPQGPMMAGPTGEPVLAG